MVRKTTLKNGLRVVTKALDSTKAVTVLVLVGAGSRYETKNINGIAHFLEHMFFKGAEKYKNTEEVSEAIDGVGGDFNAFTGKEYVGYYVKVASEHVDVAMSVLSDMLLNAALRPEDIDRERGVILEEFNMYQDTPMYQIGWNFERLLFGDQPLGWDQIGTKELIQFVTEEQFRDYRKKFYTPDNIVVAIFGNMKYADVIKKVEEFFPFEKSVKHSKYAPYNSYTAPFRVHLTNKKTEQAHIVCGVQSYPEEHEYSYTQKLLSVILGGNMSSRMFLNVREKQGLAYYIHTTTDEYTDIGTLSTGAGVDVTRTYDAVKATIAEYKKIAGEDVPGKELKKAKEYLKGKLILRLENSEEYAHLVGKKELLFDKVTSPEEILKKVDDVSAADIRAVAEELFREERMNLAVIGPFTDKEKFLEMMKF